MKFKPSADQWRTIKEVALRGHDTNSKPITSIAGVRLECKSSYNHADMQAGKEGPPPSINLMLVSHAPDNGCNDCDMLDKSVQLTQQFRTGAPLTATGDGLFDFYIYNRYDLDQGDLAGNVLVSIKGGQMVSIWIEGGREMGWTPETGIAPRVGRSR